MKFFIIDNSSWNSININAKEKTVGDFLYDNPDFIALKKKKKSYL